jgi:prepilin-type N-terminal cleavage/methylation domain-containing protein
LRILSLKAKHNAFTLLEILIVMVVIGFMATIISPWLFQKKPEATWDAVLDEVNDLVYFARQEAISNQITYRLFFRSNKEEPDFVVVEREEDNPEKPGSKIYKQVFSEYVNTRYTFPPNIKMQAFYVRREESFSENKDNAYCYVISNGLVEDAIIRITRVVDGAEQRASFKMAPFFGKFDYNQGFLRSEKK